MHVGVTRGMLGFEPYTFVALVDKVNVRKGKALEFIFRNGMKYVTGE